MYILPCIAAAMLAVVDLPEFVVGMTFGKFGEVFFAYQEVSLFRLLHFEGHNGIAQVEVDGKEVEHIGLHLRIDALTCCRGLYLFQHLLIRFTL